MTKAATYPVINSELCGADHDCVDLCEQGVLEIPENGMEPVVAHPERCIEGCTLCVDICRMNAITLRDYAEASR